MGKIKTQYCGVPQCRSHKNPTNSMHQIPKKVLNNKKELLRWKIALKMGKPFPKYFVICSIHFKSDKILVPILRNKRPKAKLLDSAFPTENLPQSTINTKRCIDKIKTRYTRLMKRNSSVQAKCSNNDNNLDMVLFEQEQPYEYFHQVNQSVGVQTNNLMFDKCIQVTEDLEYNDLPFKIDSDNKLKTMTGIATRILLEKIVECCTLIRPLEEKENSMSLKSRIFLTMYRIKTNASNAQTAILFNLSQKTASFYFKDCVQLLATALKPSIYWQSEKISYSNLSYIDDIRTIICGISNLSLPILNEQILNFLK